MEKSSVQYGTSCINFYVKRRDRKTLAIEVHPNLEVVIISPRGESLETIKKKVAKRAAWIIRQQIFFQSFLPRTPERNYVSGETHYYLGRRYLLKVTEGTKNEVKLMSGNIIVYLKRRRKREENHVRLLLEKWYKNHRKLKFQERFENAWRAFQSYPLETPAIESRKMKNRWGSCTPKGKIILNSELIKTPVKCIDYVIHHELCHLVHPNHSQEFYKLQTKVNADWKHWKQKLESALI